MKRTKLLLAIATGVLLLTFIVTLFNPFKNDDVRYYRATNYFNIQIEEREDKYDDEYLFLKIENINNNDVYDISIVFGHKANNYSEDNYIWFRKAIIHKNETITISLYEDTGKINVKSDKVLENYEVSISPKAPNLEIENCMTIESLAVDSEEPKIVKVSSYWSIEKTIFAVLTGVSGMAWLIVYLLEKKKRG